MKSINKKFENAIKLNDERMAAAQKSIDSLREAARSGDIPFRDVKSVIAKAREVIELCKKQRADIESLRDLLSPEN